MDILLSFIPGADPKLQMFMIRCGGEWGRVLFKKLKLPGSNKEHDCRPLADREMRSVCIGNMLGFGHIPFGVSKRLGSRLGRDVDIHALMKAS